MINIDDLEFDLEFTYQGKLCYYSFAKDNVSTLDKEGYTYEFIEIPKVELKLILMLACDELKEIIKRKIQSEKC